MGAAANATRRAWIAGAAHALPSRSVTNEELPASLQVDASAIFKRTGIRARHWAPPGVATSDLGAEAARGVLEKTGIEAARVDCLIAATMTPDQSIPGIGVIIQQKLGLSDIPCFDIRDQCCGFLYSLQVARALVEAGAYSCVLVVCAEIQSHSIGFEPEDAHISSLFGDGAAAVLVLPTPHGKCPLTPVWQTLGSDGSGASKLRHRLWNVANVPPWDLSQFDEPAHRVQFPEMDGEAVFRAAVKRIVSSVQSCFKQLGLTAQDIDWLMPHQANANINKTAASILGFPSERICANIERVGNCSGASLPILLSETLERSAIRPGQRVLMVAFGAGFTWGATLLETAA
jgi:3-oxoacyl-[acyl-carrier-protein] synthase-3